jgi:hypothetical protein
VAECGENIAQWTIVRGGITDAVRGQQRQVKGASDFHGNAVPCFFFAVIVALQFNVYIVAAKDADKSISDTACFGRASFLYRSCKWAFVAACHANEPAGIVLQFMLENGSFFFALRAKFHTRDELAEILVSGAGSDEQRKAEVAVKGGLQSECMVSLFFCLLWVRVCPERSRKVSPWWKRSFRKRKRFATDLSPDMSPRTDFLGCQMKPRRPVKTIPVKQSHRRHATRRTDPHQVLRQGRAFKKAECGAGVEFDVHGRAGLRCQVSGVRKIKPRKFVL